MKETFAYYEITLEIIEKLEDDVNYPYHYENKRIHCNSGKYIKDYPYEITHIQLPFSPPKDVSDEQIKEQFWTDHYDEPELNDKNFLRQEGAKWMRSKLAGKQPDREFMLRMFQLWEDLAESGQTSMVSVGKDFLKSYDEIKQQMNETVLNEPKPDHEFIIQKMNELVNDILCNPIETADQYYLMKYPNSNNIAKRINDWADKNLMEGKESDAVENDRELLTKRILGRGSEGAINFAEWICNEGYESSNPFDSVVFYGKSGTDECLTTKELYELFKTETR